MKSAMPFHGVPTPLLRKIARTVFGEVPFASAAHWRKYVLALWRGAQFREERYAALLLAGDRRAEPFQTFAAMIMYEEMIVTGAWWDFVDDIAAHRIGGSGGRRSAGPSDSTPARTRSRSASTSEARATA